MNMTIVDEVTELVTTEQEDLKPKPPPRLAPRGIRTFTVCRQIDETGVSGEGVVIEGVSLASGHCIIHWLFPHHVVELQYLTP